MLSLCSLFYFTSSVLLRLSKHKLLWFVKIEGEACHKCALIHG